MKIGMLTGGGDCPGLNAVIRAVVRKGIFTYEDELVGFMEGWRGVVDDISMPLDLDAVGGILPRGGTTCVHRAPIPRSAPTASTAAWPHWKRIGSRLWSRSAVTTLFRLLKNSTNAAPKLSASPRPSTTIWAAPTTPSDSTPPAT